MKYKTATLPTIGQNADGVQELFDMFGCKPSNPAAAAVVASLLSGPASGAITFTCAEDHEIDADGFPVGLSDQDKLEDHLKQKQSREHEAQEAEQVGNPQHAAWARGKAAHERQQAAKYEQTGHGTPPLRPRVPARTALRLPAGQSPAESRALAAARARPRRRRLTIPSQNPPAAARAHGAAGTSTTLRPAPSIAARSTACTPTVRSTRPTLIV